MDQPGEVTFKIYASLLHWAKKPEIKLTLPNPQNLSALLPQLGIPEEEVAVVVRNGKQVKLDTVIVPGDTVSLFPVIDGG
jgi:sulfur carrier protein ThiS